MHFRPNFKCAVKIVDKNNSLERVLHSLRDKALVDYGLVVDQRQKQLASLINVAVKNRIGDTNSCELMIKAPTIFR